MDSYHDAVDTLSCSSGGRSEDVLDQLLERYTLDVRPKWCAKLRKRCGSLDVSVDYLLGEPARLQGLSVAVKSFGAYKKLRWWDKVQWDVGNGDARLYTKKIPMGILRLQVSARPRCPLPPGPAAPGLGSFATRHPPSAWFRSRPAGCRPTAPDAAGSPLQAIAGVDLAHRRAGLSWRVSTAWTQTLQSMERKESIPLNDHVEVKPHWAVDFSLPAMEGEMGAGGDPLDMDLGNCHMSVPQVDVICRLDKEKPMRRVF